MGKSLVLSEACVIGAKSGTAAIVIYFVARSWWRRWTHVTHVVMPIIIIVLWWIGLVALSLRFLAIFGVCRYRLATAFSLSALITVAPAINAFHSPMSFYWLAASMRYCLPLAVLTIYIASLSRQNTVALSLGTSESRLCWRYLDSRSHSQLADSQKCIMVFQLSVLSVLRSALCPGAGLHRKDHALRRKYLVRSVMASWLGTRLASAAILLLSLRRECSLRMAASYTANLIGDTNSMRYQI